MTIAPYSTTPVFDEHTLPAALRADHRTKDGTWGLLRVLTGEVRLVFIDPPRVVQVTSDTPATIPPQDTHYVETLGAMTMQVEFYKADPTAPD